MRYSNESGSRLGQGGRQRDVVEGSRGWAFQADMIYLLSGGSTEIHSDISKLVKRGSR